MYVGGTDLIVHHLSLFRNVTYLCPSRQEAKRVFYNAREFFDEAIVKLSTNDLLIDFGSAHLRFRFANASNPHDMRHLLDRLRGERSIIINHPQLNLSHPNAHGLIDYIDYRNSTYGSTKPRTT